MKVALVYSDLNYIPKLVSKVNPGGPIQMERTKNSLKNALEWGGHEVFEVVADVNMLKNIVDEGNIDVIFCHYMPMLDLYNQGNVFAALELLGIPMVGSGMYTQAVALSKETSKMLLREHNIPTAKSQIFITGDEELKEELKSSFPLFVKPEAEAQSVGVLKKSVVHNEEEMRNVIKELLEVLHPPILVEEYLQGREFTMGVLEGETLEAMPPIEFIFKEDDEIKFQSVERKASNDVPIEIPADISDEKRQEMEEISKKVFKIFRAKGYFRIDFRENSKGELNVIEVNSMPGLDEGKSFFNRSAVVKGYSYNELINKMVENAIKYDDKSHRDFPVGKF